MVFCLCSRRCCFSKTLVINTGNKKNDTLERRSTYYPHIGADSENTAYKKPNVDKKELKNGSVVTLPPVSSQERNVQAPQSTGAQRSTADVKNGSVVTLPPVPNQEINVQAPQGTGVQRSTEDVKITSTEVTTTGATLPPLPSQEINVQAPQGIGVQRSTEDVKITSTEVTRTEATISGLHINERPGSGEYEKVENTNQNQAQIKTATKKAGSEGRTASKKDRAPAVPVSNRSPSPTRTSQSVTDRDDSEVTSSGYLSTRSLELDTPKTSVNEFGNVTEERREGVAPIIPVRVDHNLNDKLPVYIKDPSDEDLIRNAIKSNDFLHKVISGEQLTDVIAAMYNREISAKEVIVKQGDKGSHMYVSAKGNFQVTVNGKTVSQFSDVRVFGELAILYNAKRLATIKALTAGRVWVLDSNVYQKIMLRHNLKNEEEVKDFLMNNEILNVVGKDALQVVSTLLKSEFFQPGKIIVKQGDRGDKFYIIRAGTVTITKEGEGIVGVYKKGDCFGELALLEEDCRQATVTANDPGVECLTLSRKEFVDHLGEVKNFKYIKVKNKPKDSIKSVQAEHDDINLFDLKIIKTLGVGGFGRVELVQHTKNENIVFALKYLKKVEIVQQNQQEHVFNEKKIQMSARSPFIVRLYRTYRDTKYIYFLMESCLGGDLWSLLQRQKNKRFEEKEARFICACVVLAFEYLHSKGVIYRDLKPENLLLSVNGYIKLTDFGFAKKISDRGKTYTFAGTPEYVAPEIVLNRGHDRAVDYWAFGAFVYEMLSGRTPFRTDDSSHMKTYNKILGGIDNVPFPTYINLKARHLIEKLCRPVPSERLGMQKNGIQDIKNHKWFLGLDWERLQKWDIPSPFKPKLNGPVDTKYFDHFKRDTDKTPEELSGWDEEF